MAPVLEELRKDYTGNIQVEFVDIWKKPWAALKYGVRMIPTQIFYDASGKELYRQAGFMAKEDILKKLKELNIAVSKAGEIEPMCHVYSINLLPFPAYSDGKLVRHYFAYAPPYLSS